MPTGKIAIKYTFLYSCKKVGEINFIMLINKLVIKLPKEKRKIELISNIERNWYLPVSAIAFFSLSSTLTVGYFIGVILAFFMVFIISSQISSIRNYTKKNKIWLQILSALTAIGICWCAKISFCTKWILSPKTQALSLYIPNAIYIMEIISIIGALVGFFFVYFCTIIFYKKAINIITECSLFSKINKLEIFFYSLILLITSITMIYIFLQTNAFYESNYGYDIIYTSDPPFRKDDNVYMALNHPENDIRQPLFAVFSAPLVSIPYLIGNLFSSVVIQAILMNLVQIVLMFLANFMLTKVMNLSRIQRMSFIFLISFTYTNLLFSLMMEQYIFAYFWLMLCVYTIFTNRHFTNFLIFGAIGTLSTSVFLLPFLSKKLINENLKKWFADIMKYSLEFILLMIFFCKFDVFYNLKLKILSLSSFTGQNLTIIDKFRQYTEFIHNCIFAPTAGETLNSTGHISWQLNQIIDINIIGIIIFLLVIISAILNKNKEFTLFSISWVAFSVLILFIFGWGTQENGLILYSLYFGWAFIVLIFQLIQYIEENCKIKFLIPLFCIITVFALVLINIPAMMQLINFAIKEFPL